MSCNDPGRFSTEERASLARLLADPVFRGEVELNQVMYRELIFKEAVYRLPRIDPVTGQPVYENNLPVFDEVRVTPIPDIVTRLIAFMPLIGGRLVDLLGTTLAREAPDIARQDGICLLCKHYVDTTYDRLPT